MCPSGGWFQIELERFAQFWELFLLLGLESLEEMAPLARELIRWLQMLSTPDLPLTVRQPKRDLSNGFYFAAICSRYWADVEMHNYENKVSTKNKEANWKCLRRVFRSHQVPVTEQDVQDIIAMKDEVAINVLEILYTALTSRVIQKVAPLDEQEVQQIPTFIRSTNNATMQVPEVREQTSPTLQQSPQNKPEQQQATASPAKRASPRAPKPKPAQKSQAIRAVTADEAEDAADAKPVQFTAVTVKALAPQTLQRMGQSSEGQRAGRQSSAKTVGADGHSVTALLSTQIEKVLADTSTAPWPLSGAVATSADYFSRNRAYLQPSLKNIIWSRLSTAADETAAWLLGRPADFGEFLEFLHGAFEAPREPANDSAQDNEKARQYFATTVGFMSNKNPHIMLSMLRSSFLPSIAGDLLRNVQGMKDKAAQVLYSAESPAVAGTLLLPMLHEALVKEAAQEQMEEMVSMVYLQTTQTFFEASLKGSTSSKRRAVGHNASDESASGADEQVIDSPLAPLLAYHANAGLTSPSPVTRAASLAMYVSLLRTRNPHQIQSHVLSTVESILLGESFNASNHDLVAQALAFVTSAVRLVSQYDAETSSEYSTLAASLLSIIARLCGKSRLYAPGVFSAAIRQHILLELGSIVDCIRDTAALAGQKPSDAEAIENNLLDSLLGLKEKALLSLLGDTSEGALELSSTLYGSSSPYQTTGGANSWNTLPLVEALLRKHGPSKGSDSPARADVLKAVSRFVVTRDVSKMLCLKESELPRWWDAMKAIVHDIESAMYGAEIASQRSAGKPENLDIAAAELGETAVDIVVRFYIHLSGVPISGDHDDEHALKDKAVEWFRTIVATSSS